jgi:beta-phosphoglucomutase
VFEAILFDFDGVIADSESVHFQSWGEILAPLGVPLSWEFYCSSCIGVSDRKTVDLFCNGLNYSVSQLDDLCFRKRDLFRKKAVADPPVVESTKQLIRHLKGKYKLAVVTSSGRNEVQPVLEVTGLWNLLDTFVCMSDVERLKPHPDPYLEAARRLSVQHVLVVEDSDPGEASGRAAGFEVLRIPHPERLSELVLERLSSLPQ